jgi:hypothetical protein
MINTKFIIQFLKKIKHKKVTVKVLNLILTILSPFTLVSTLWLKFIKLSGINGISEKIFMSIGLLPIVDQYYQPLINPKKYLTKSLRDDRSLIGIDFNVQQQLDLLKKFQFNDELLKFPLDKNNENEFYYNNGTFLSGDAEYLYNIVRHFKPKSIIEIGCGNSTLMIRNAIKTNLINDGSYNCNHFCIEPYEQPWLDKIEIELIREKVEQIDISFFQKLQPNDILFIDSSHVIRPQGDVLFEYLEILPILKPGVIIHIHDIFSPKDYLNNWVLENHFLWNEQYLLEAFLSFNSKFKIIGALNYLAHNYTKEFVDKCPIFGKQSGEPGSFWLIKTE